MKTAAWWGIGLACIGMASALAEPVVPGVELIPGRFLPDEQPDGNTVIFAGKSGLIVFDTGRHRDHTQAILDFAKTRKQPVAAIINSHWHLDHVGGNVLLRQTYPNVQVYASNAIDGALHGFLADYRESLQKRMDAAGDDAAKQQPLKDEIALIDAGDQLKPDHPVTNTGERDIAGRKLMLGLEHDAATAGDVWAFDAASGVLASGDLVTLPVPFLDTACPQGWQKSLDALEKVEFKWLVPGHGAPMQRAQFERYRTAFGDLLACGASTRSKAECEEGWLQDVGDLVAADQQKFTRALLDYYLDHSLRAEPAHNAKLCAAA